MKVLSVLLKIIETIIVCIWGVAVGILFPVVIMTMGSEIVPEDIAQRTDIMVIWIISSVLFVFAAALMFGKHYRIAAGVSLFGLAGILIVDAMFAEQYRFTQDSTGPDSLYLPLIFAFMLDIFILAIEERKNIAKLFEAKRKKKDEKAPSILGDD